jgi:hypothetical protein
MSDIPEFNVLRLRYGFFINELESKRATVTLT